MVSLIINRAKTQSKVKQKVLIIIKNNNRSHLHKIIPQTINPMPSPSSQPQPTLSPQPPAPIRKPQKITQLLCYDQNIQLKSIFTTWLSQSFKYLPKCLEYIYLELELIINFIEYRFTVSRDKPQVGDYLQNIKYKDLSKKTKILFLVLDVVGPYLKRRLLMLAEKLVDRYQTQLSQLSHEDNQQQSPSMRAKLKIVSFLKRTLSIISFLQKIYALSNFINLAIFIKNGKYRTLIQRFLSMQMQFVNPQNSRVLDFTLMNRTMIWQIYQMVLKNILPYLYKFLGTGLKNVFYLHSYMGVEEKEDEEGCVVCGDVPTMVVKAQPCGHLCCFYCSKSEQDQKLQCKKCAQPIEGWETLYA